MVWCNSMNTDRKYVEGHAPKPADFFLTRRQFLQRAGMGFGALGLATLLAEDCLGAAPVQDAEPLSALAPRSPHFPAKAKHVVHIFAQGAPSHVDTFDPKPELTKFDGKSIPGYDGTAMGSPFKSTKRGKCGIEVSEVFPKLGDMVDDLAIIR